MNGPMDRLIQFALEDATRIRLVATSAVSYAMLFLILFWQAFQRQSIVYPDTNVMVALMSWAVLTIAAIATVAGRSVFERSHVTWRGPHVAH